MNEERESIDLIGLELGGEREVVSLRLEGVGERVGVNAGTGKTPGGSQEAEKVLQN